uniref:Uncharacterized protein n=1 Tax=Peronospora matthiolae TaxID=2874970 RepID=A0AAV1V0W5_9STRA
MGSVRRPDGYGGFSVSCDVRQDLTPVPPGHGNPSMLLKEAVPSLLHRARGVVMARWPLFD